MKLNQLETRQLTNKRICSANFYKSTSISSNAIVQTKNRQRSLSSSMNCKDITTDCVV